MVAFEIEPSQNLFVVRYQGAVGPDEVQRGLEQVRSGLAKLQSGFRLLADLTELQSMEISCAPFIKQAMDLFNQKGVSMVVRVIPDPTRDIGMQIMSLFHYGGNVRILTCQTRDQATNLLSSDS
jgi:anti-anti-sigma regulatory factor